jgi:hypothetical protein
MTAADQDERGVSVAMPANAFGCRNQLFHFLLGQVFPAVHIMICKSVFSLA